MAVRPARRDLPKALVLAIILTGSFMILVDVSIVNVAIPSIRAGLHTTTSEIELILTGYQVTYAVLLITGGRLGDRFGRRRLFVIGLAGFCLASAGCGFAVSGLNLVAFRVIQGAFGAMLYPQVLSIIQVVFDPSERPRALSILGLVVALGLVAGPVLGGTLITLNWFGAGWRLVFLVNLPIGIACIVAALIYIPNVRSTDPPRIDPVGVVLALATIGSFILPLVDGREIGWPPWTWCLLGASAPLLLTFVVVERRRARRQRPALIEPSLLHIGTYIQGLIATGVAYLGIPAFSLMLSVFLQSGLGVSPLFTGLIFLPFAAGSFAMAVPAGRLTPRFGRRVVWVGLALTVVGSTAMMGVAQIPHLQTQLWWLAPPLFVFGCGLRLVITPLFTITLSETRGHQSGSASGVLTTVQQLGGATGIAVTGIVFFGLLTASRPQTAYLWGMAVAVGAYLLAAAVATGLPRRLEEGEPR